MNEYDVTKLPFTSISRENWQMLLELDKDSLYDVIQHIGNYVMSGECNCETTLSRVVCGQVISVIDRRGKGYWERTKHLKQGKEQKAEKAPVSEPEPVQEPVQEPPKVNKYKDLPWEDYLKLFIKQHPSFNYDMDSDSFVSTYGDTLERFQNFVYDNFCATEKIPLSVLAFEISYYYATGRPYSGEENNIK